MSKNDRDAMRDAPAFHRNITPITEVLDRYLSLRTGNVIEVGSGTGQHVVAFARAFPQLVWWPTDIEPSNLASIRAWTMDSGLDNIRRPLPLDASAKFWPSLPTATAMLAVNVFHIAPWSAVVGVFVQAARLLAADGLLFAYGPYSREGRHLSGGNVRFDRDLRGSNSKWGIRDTSDIYALATSCGLKSIAEVAMPANNLTLVFASDLQPAEPDQS